MTTQARKNVSARNRLASNMRRLRAGLGMSQEALADLGGLHRTYVGSVERSERNVSLDNIEKLAQALKVDITDLLADNSGSGEFQGRPIQDRGT